MTTGTEKEMLGLRDATNVKADGSVAIGVVIGSVAAAAGGSTRGAEGGEAKKWLSSG